MAIADSQHPFYVLLNQWIWVFVLHVFSSQYSVQTSVSVVPELL